MLILWSQYPICHGAKPLLGVLYLEGNPGAFTDRNVTVLQLLVNQIGISYSNALSLKAIEKVSSENASMIEAQKRALLKAQEAETKAKAAEATARQNEKRAEEAAKAKAIFLANVSHELRTPLNGVIGNSELLRDSSLSKEQLEMADSIRVSADLLLTVINDILDFSKMEADKMKVCFPSCCTVLAQVAPNIETFSSTLRLSIRKKWCARSFALSRIATERRRRSKTFLSSATSTCHQCSYTETQSDCIRSLAI